MGRMVKNKRPKMRSFWGENCGNCLLFFNKIFLKYDHFEAKTLGNEIIFTGNLKIFSHYFFWQFFKLKIRQINGSKCDRYERRSFDIFKIVSFIDKLFKNAWEENAFRGKNFKKLIVWGKNIEMIILWENYEKKSLWQIIRKYSSFKVSKTAISRVSLKLFRFLTSNCTRILKNRLFCCCCCWI